MARPRRGGAGDPGLRRIEILSRRAAAQILNAKMQRGEAATKVAQVSNATRI